MEPLEVRPTSGGQFKPGAVHSRPGDVVFDAFTGTGSTGIAAVKLGRDFIGCEMSEQHHADAISRIARVSKPQEIMQLDLLELAEV